MMLASESHSGAISPVVYGRCVIGQLATDKNASYPPTLTHGRSPTDKENMMSSIAQSGSDTHTARPGSKIETNRH